VRSLSDEDLARSTDYGWTVAGLDESAIDSGAVNDALVPAALLAVSAAQKIEAHAEATSTQFRMNRSLHRESHLQDIEALLKR
jgi:hypothetical protein